MIADPLRADLFAVIEEIRAGQDPDVSDEFRALVEAVLATQPAQQNGEDVEQTRVWTSRLASSLCRFTLR